MAKRNKSRTWIAATAVLAVVLGVGLFNAFTAAAVPHGRTIRGAIGGDFDVQLPGGSTNGTDWAVDGTIRPATPSPGLHDADVTVAGGADTAENACTGSAASPTAPAGVVCIYPTQSSNAQNLTGYSIVAGTGASRYGFKLLWDASASNGDTFVDAVWAYKYP